jgi:hypothetical protein
VVIPDRTGPVGGCGLPAWALSAGAPTTALPGSGDATMCRSVRRSDRSHEAVTCRRRGARRAWNVLDRQRKKRYERDQRGHGLSQPAAEAGPAHLKKTTADTHTRPTNIARSPFASGTARKIRAHPVPARSGTRISAFR